MRKTYKKNKKQKNKKTKKYGGIVKSLMNRSSNIVPPMIIPVNIKDYPPDHLSHKFTIFSDKNPWKSRTYSKFKNINKHGEFDSETTFFNRKYTQNRGFKSVVCDEKWVSQYSIRIRRHPTMSRIYDRRLETPPYFDPRVTYVFQTYKLFDFNGEYNVPTFLNFSENTSGKILSCISTNSFNIDHIYNLDDINCRFITSLYNYYLHQQQFLKYNSSYRDDELKPECVTPLEYFNSSYKIGIVGLDFDISFTTNPYYVSENPDPTYINELRNKIEESHRTNPLYNSLYHKLTEYEFIDLPICPVEHDIGCAINMMHFLGWFEWRNFSNVDREHHHYEFATSDQLVMLKFKKMLWDIIPSDKQMLLYAQKNLYDIREKYKKEKNISGIDLRPYEQDIIRIAHKQYLEMIVEGQQKIYQDSQLAQKKYSGFIEKNVDILEDDIIQQLNNPNLDRGIDISYIIYILKNYLSYNSTEYTLDPTIFQGIQPKLPITQLLSFIGNVTPIEFSFDSLDGIYQIMNYIYNDLKNNQYTLVRFTLENESSKTSESDYVWINRSAHVMSIIKLDDNLFLLSVSPYKSLTKITTLTLHWLWFMFRGIQIISTSTSEQLDTSIFKDVDGIPYLKGLDDTTIHGLSPQIKVGLGQIFLDNRTSKKFKHY